MDLCCKSIDELELIGRGHGGVSAVRKPVMSRMYRSVPALHWRRIRSSIVSAEICLESEMCSFNAIPSKSRNSKHKAE